MIVAYTRIVISFMDFYVPTKAGIGYQTLCLLDTLKDGVTRNVNLDQLPAL